MSRDALPKKIKDALLDEYDHSCAVCGGDRPHVHHIDEDSSHNELHNLLPLCPNCHLSDQHNPTRKIDIPKLRLFRRHKDPAILKPQFHPIYLRQAFLDDVSQSEEPVRDLERQAGELIEFVQSLEMGESYGRGSASESPRCGARRLSPWGAAQILLGNSSDAKPTATTARNSRGCAILACGAVAVPALGE